MATRFTKETNELINSLMQERRLKRESLAHNLNMHSGDIHNALNYGSERSVHKSRLRMIADFFGVEPEFENFITRASSKKLAERKQRVTTLDLNKVIIDISTKILLETSVSKELKEKAIDLIKSHSA